MDKEKPKYNVLQNSIYALNTAAGIDKSTLLIAAARMLFAVGVSVLAIYLPKTVVAQIAAGAPAGALVAAIMLYTCAIMALNAADKYLDEIYGYRTFCIRDGFTGRILSKIMATDYQNLDNNAFHEIKVKAKEQIKNWRQSTQQIYHTLLNFGISLLGFCVYVFLLASINPLILLITASTTIAGLIMRRKASKWQYEHADESSYHEKRLYYIGGIAGKYEMAKDIRIFAMKDWLKDIYHANMRLAFDFAKGVQARYLLADIIECVAIFIREGVAYGFLIWLLLDNKLTIDRFILLFAAIGGFSTWLSGILTEYANLHGHSLNICWVRAFLEYPNAFKGEDGEAIPDSNDGYTLEFRNVSYRYSGAEKDTLHGINLIISPGDKLAIVGINGAGKTTLVKLMCGLYDPTEGEILLNGVDIRRINRRLYYELFAAVFQEFGVMPLTIAQNISQIIDGYDLEKLNECIDLAGLRDKINSLPKGVDSPMVRDVYDDAVTLSGGETQRLMLARALYKESPILILDEPTAALDPIAESNLYQRYDELSKGKTSVYISHRLASTRFCDAIILLDDKGIIEKGSHSELLAVGGKYAELFKIQSKYYGKNVEKDTDLGDDLFESR